MFIGIYISGDADMGSLMSCSYQITGISDVYGVGSTRIYIIIYIRCSDFAAIRICIYIAP